MVKTPRPPTIRGAEGLVQAAVEGKIRQAPRPEALVKAAQGRAEALDRTPRGGCLEALDRPEQVKQGRPPGAQVRGALERVARARQAQARPEPQAMRAAGRLGPEVPDRPARDRPGPGKRGAEAEG